MTTRVFTVEVTGCKDCCNLHYCDNSGNQCLHESMPDNRDFRQAIYQQNKESITESCPMYQHSFVKDEKK